MFPGFSKLPYCERLERLGLWSLEERQNRADIIEVFKMAKGWSAFALECLSYPRHNIWEDINSSWLNTEVIWKCDTSFSPKDLLTDGTVWINSHWTWTRWTVLKTIYNAYGILGWVSSWTDVRLTHWLQKFILVWPHQVNDQVNTVAVKPTRVATDWLDGDKFRRLMKLWRFHVCITVSRQEYRVMTYHTLRLIANKTSELLYENICTILKWKKNS